MSDHEEHKMDENSLDAHHTSKEQNAQREALVLSKIEQLGEVMDADVQDAVGGDVVGWRVQPKISVLIDRGLVVKIRDDVNPRTQKTCRVVRLATEEERQSVRKKRVPVVISPDTLARAITALEHAKEAATQSNIPDLNSEYRSCERAIDELKAYRTYKHGS